MGVDPAGRGDQVLPGDDLGPRADDKARVYVLHRARIPGIADPDDPPILDPDVPLEDTKHGIHHDRVRDHQIERPAAIGRLGGLPHPIPRCLPPAEDQFIARRNQVALDPTDQPGISKPKTVPDRWPIQLGILATADTSHSTPLDEVRSTK
jgi:hypothetical protein